MDTRALRFSLVAALFLSAGCTSAPVNMSEPRRIVGTESAVRVDAEIRGEEMRPGAAIPISYTITNNRDVMIAVADILPMTSFDAESRMVTVTVGAEVPGEALLPRLVSIPPGESRSFVTSARFVFVAGGSADPYAPQTAELRLKVNFLGDVAPFQSLLDIPEKGVADKALADSLFPVWLERNESVYTNTVPLRLNRDGTGFSSGRTGQPAPGRRSRGVP